MPHAGRLKQTLVEIRGMSQEDPATAEAAGPSGRRSPVHDWEMP
jgi:hypothetical protein